MVVLKSLLCSPPLQGTSKLKLIFSGNFKIAAIETATKRIVCRSGCSNCCHSLLCHSSTSLGTISIFQSSLWQQFWVLQQRLQTINIDWIFCSLLSLSLSLSLSQNLKLLSLSTTLFLSGSCFTKYVNDNRGLTTNDHFES